MYSVSARAYDFIITSRPKGFYRRFYLWKVSSLGSIRSSRSFHLGACSLSKNIAPRSVNVLTTVVYVLLESRDTTVCVRNAPRISPRYTFSNNVRGSADPSFSYNFSEKRYCRIPDDASLIIFKTILPRSSVFTTPRFLLSLFVRIYKCFVVGRRDGFRDIFDNSKLFSRRRRYYVSVFGSVWIIRA